MSPTVVQTRFDEDSFAQFLLSRQEPDWLQEFRRDSWQQFQRFELPNRSQEEWIRTDIRLFKLDQFGFCKNLPESQLVEPVLSFGVELAGQTASRNGCSVDATLADRWAQKGVIFGDLGTVLQEHSHLIRPHLMTQAFNPKFDKFSALHAAGWSSGTVLYVPRNVIVDEPFHALSVLQDGGADLGHVLVILEEGAEATVLGEMRSPNENHSGMHCGGTELILGPRARLRFVNLQDWGKGVWHFAHQKAVLADDASLQWTVGALGSRLAKVNQHVVLAGRRAECQVNGVLFTEGKQHLSYHTLQHHQVPDCRSDFLYKAALQDKSRTVWRGMIQVDEDAQKTDGYQRNDNLLLSADARADAIPGLEIEADDVRCTHGSTTGRVDEELLFYAQCRGFTRKEAVRLIVTGFFQQVFDRVTLDSVREALGLAIARRVREYQ